MSNSVKKAKRQIVVDVIILLIIAAIIIAVVWILSSGKTTTSSTPVEEGNSSSLLCKTSSDKDSFYDVEYGHSVNIELKLTLSKEKLDKISLEYTGSYQSEQIAEAATASLNAKYNKYLGKNDIPLNIYSPTFVNNGKELSINLFSKSTDINSISSKLFFIDASEFNKVKGLSGANLKKLFENKGFSCEFYE